MVQLRRIACVFLFACAITAPHSSKAQRRGRGHHSSRESPEDAARHEALALFQEGVASFRARDYPTALTIFERAFRRFPEPVLLLNIARTLERLDRNDEALARYQDYLATSATQERALAEERVAALQPPPTPRANPPRQRNAPSSAVAVREPEERVTAPARDTHASSSGVDPAPWIVFTLGALALGGGIIAAFIAQEQMRNAGMAESQLATRDQTQRAFDLATLSNLLMFGGGGVAAFGAIWGIASLGGDDENDTHARLELGVGSLTLRGRF